MINIYYRQKKTNYAFVVESYKKLSVFKVNCTVLLKVKSVPYFNRSEKRFYKIYNLESKLLRAIFCIEGFYCWKK